MHINPAERQAVLDIVAAFLEHAHSANDPHQNVFANAEAEAPLLVEQDNGQHAFWRIPLFIKTQPPRRGWIDVSHEVPNRVLRYGLYDKPEDDLITMNSNDIAESAVEVSGATSTLSELPSVVFIETPAKTAWKCRMKRSDGSEVDVFVTPGHAFTHSDMSERIGREG